MILRRGVEKLWPHIELYIAREPDDPTRQNPTYDKTPLRQKPVNI